MSTLFDNDGSMPSSSKLIIPGSEPLDADSYTDETSARISGRNKHKVWIHAQVSSTDRLEWFFELYNHFSDLSGELKDSAEASDYFRYPLSLRQRISPGLRRTRIHIVDTFVYEAEGKQVMRSILKCDDYEKILREKESPLLAKSLIQATENYVSSMILLDSPMQRLERNLLYGSSIGYGLFQYRAEQEQARRRREFAMDLDPFKKGRKKLSDTAAKWVSKAGSVFSDAVEFSENIMIGEYQMRQRVAAMLDKSHAFDVGDDKSIEWLESQRKQFIIDSVYGVCGFLRPLYGNIDSKLSRRTQAADIAGKIAERVYGKFGLEGVMERFDYVTFNGERVNEGNISRILDHWSVIREREERIQKLIEGIS